MSDTLTAPAITGAENMLNYSDLSGGFSSMYFCMFAHFGFVEDSEPYLLGHALLKALAPHVDPEGLVNDMIHAGDGPAAIGASPDGARMTTAFAMGIVDCSDQPLAAEMRAWCDGFATREISLQLEAERALERPNGPSAKKNG